MVTIKINEHIGIRQFFTRQIFPNPDSSIFSTVKILCLMVGTRLILFMSLTEYTVLLSVLSTLVASGNYI